MTGITPKQKKRVLLLVLWVVLMSCIAVGELLPAASPVMVAVDRLHVNDKLEHFGAYLVLSLLAVIGFQERRQGIIVGLSMFVLGILLEGAQHFSPGRSVELGDVIANGVGVSCGSLLGLPLRVCLAFLYPSPRLTAA